MKEIEVWTVWRTRLDSCLKEIERIAHALEATTTDHERALTLNGTVTLSLYLFRIKLSHWPSSSRVTLKCVCGRKDTKHLVENLILCGKSQRFRALIESQKRLHFQFLHLISDICLLLYISLQSKHLCGKWVLSLTRPLDECEDGLGPDERAFGCNTHQNREQLKIDSHAHHSAPFIIKWFAWYSPNFGT